MLYLINLMLLLDLPDSFEEDWQLSAAGPWAVLDALGRGLLALDGIDPAPDPLWAALALLQGRDPRDRVGEGFRGSDAFRLPAAWAPEGQAFYTVTGDRCLGWSEQGYWLFDLPRTQPVPEGATYAESLPPIPHPGGRILEEVAPGLARWLVRVLPYLHHRLARVLRLEPGESLTDVLLRVRARLYMTSTHLDMVMSMESTSLRIRMAGLDRNPGWLRSFGRVVLFHFK